MLGKLSPATCVFLLTSSLHHIQVDSACSSTLVFVCLANKIHILCPATHSLIPTSLSSPIPTSFQLQPNRLFIIVQPHPTDTTLCLSLGSFLYCSPLLGVRLNSRPPWKASPASSSASPLIQGAHVTFLSLAICFQCQHVASMQSLLWQLLFPHTSYLPTLGGRPCWAWTVPSLCRVFSGRLVRILIP